MQEILDSVTLVSLARASAMFGGFVVALFVLSRLMPGRRLQGVELADGTRITYKLNGLAIFFTVWAAVGVATLGLGHTTLLAVVYDHFWPLLIVANIFAFAMTGVLYLQGRRRWEGSVVGGLFYGTELNPNWLGVDLKMFSYRPSLIGLHLIVASFAYAQYRQHGVVSTPMWLTQIFFFIYLANYFQFEYGMVHTWDVIAERFGWMLVWGDYVLVPFFYSIVGWTLIGRTEPLAPLAVTGLCALFAAGFWLFRGSNQQKHRYKTDRTASIWGRPAETVGGRLLVSGFWGVGRHLNYTGEIMIYFAFTLPAGFGSMSAYLLPLWLTGLLVHRAWRDDRRCRAKYGELWDEYCSRAKFRMVPFIY